jgi:hypothetical protein
MDFRHWKKEQLSIIPVSSLDALLSNEVNPNQLWTSKNMNNSMTVNNNLLFEIADLTSLASFVGRGRYGDDMTPLNI